MRHHFPNTNDTKADIQQGLTPAAMLTDLERVLGGHEALQAAISDRAIARPGARRMECVAELHKELVRGI